MAAVSFLRPARLGVAARPYAARLRAPRWLLWPLALADVGAASESRPESKRARDAEPAAAQPAPSAGFDAFVREHERAILNYLWRMTGDEQSAFDLAQEVFFRAWRRFERVRAYEKPRAWLFHVATNLALTALARRRALTSEVDLTPERGPEMSDPAGRLIERDLVRATLRRLNPQRRAALCLREVYGLSCAEVAKALGISEAAARMTLSRAREQFRELYLREEGGDHDA
jgi:RNA polymerase sigma-70 factor, ECF subfamily